MMIAEGPKLCLLTKCYQIIAPFQQGLHRIMDGDTDEEFDFTNVKGIL